MCAWRSYTKPPDAVLPAGLTPLFIVHTSTTRRLRGTLTTTEADELQSQDPLGGELG